MKVSSINDLLEMSEGTVPEAFRGKIKNVYRPSTGEGRNGPFHLQKLLITDGSASIEIMVDGRAEVSRNMEGAEIYCIASRGQRGLGGLKRKDNVYKNKTTPQVWVYDNADVSFNGNDQPADNPPPQNTQRQQNQQGNAPQQNQRTQGNQNNQQRAPQQSQQPPQQNQQNQPVSAAEQQEKTMKEFDACLAKNAVALQRCFDAALNLVGEVHSRLIDNGGFTISNEAIKEVAVTLFINTVKERTPGTDKFFPKISWQQIEERRAASQNNN